MLLLFCLVRVRQPFHENYVHWAREWKKCRVLKHRVKVISVENEMATNKKNEQAAAQTKIKYANMRI